MTLPDMPRRFPFGLPAAYGLVAVLLLASVVCVGWILAGHTHEPLASSGALGHACPICAQISRADERIAPSECPFAVVLAFCALVVLQDFLSPAVRREFVKSGRGPPFFSSL